jgi:hypothetical protein
MDGRDAFLTMARDKHYEFSSLRRCKYSTLVMLYELHTQVKQVFSYRYYFAVRGFGNPDPKILSGFRFGSDQT